ncbi:hypothetical protein SCUCBS95973_006222 [Sporothrix curviconia]|uniref:Protein kinase domain-containing protein n=1 Tax=Sporothrix curviconia TaxID=1260050 RepID=A0ABP0C3F6_9PEZI
MGKGQKPFTTSSLALRRLAFRETGEDLCREAAVYRHLPKGHPRLLRLYDVVDDGDIGVSLALEYMPNGTLHEYLRGYTFREFLNSRRLPCDRDQADMERRMTRRHDSLPLRQRALWAPEAADGVVLLHAHNVMHADLKPENMGVDADLHVRILDLAGSSLGDRPPRALESTRYFMPRASWSVCNTKTECFALGSSIYHIVTGSRPYDMLPDDEVDARYGRGEFPDLSGQTTEHVPKDGDTTGVSPATGQLLFTETIRRCWHGEWDSAADVFAALQSEVAQTFDAADLQWIQQQGGFVFEKGE